MFVCSARLKLPSLVQKKLLAALLASGTSVSVTSIGEGE